MATDGLVAGVLLTPDVNDSLPLADTSEVDPARLLSKSKVSPLLQRLTDGFQESSPLVGSQPLVDYLQRDDAGQVDVHFSGEDVGLVLEPLQKLGFEPLFVDLERNTLDGLLPTSAIGALSSLVHGLSVGVVPNYRPMTSAGSVRSEADIVQQVDRVRASVPGFDGTGMRIGVLSDSYNNLGGAAADIVSGDLPATVTVLQDLGAGGSDEGRAMLQLVHDLAPGAALGFATAFVGGQAGFAANISALATTFNADVIVDDVFYFAEPYFQDGVIAQAVNNAVQNQDVAYFSSAGNLADQAFELSGPFTVGATTFAANNFGVPTVSLATALDLDPGSGTDRRQSITLQNGQQALLGLQWDDPFFASVDTDVDLYLIDSTNNEVVAFGAADNISSDEPFEILGFTNTTGAARTYEIIIDRFDGPTPGRLKWVNFGANSTGAISTIEYDTNSPTITPHAAAAHAMAVGAVPYFDQRTPESFTSIGPATFLFDSAGTPLASPEVRNKPDVASIDGTNTTFFGGDAEGDGRPNFFGTSAAAPHAAAIAALVRQANPTFTASDTYDRLQQTAWDLGAVGFDNVTGAGLINAYKAIHPTVAIASLPFAEGFESSVDAYWEFHSDRNGRIQIGTTGAAEGTRHLTMDTFFGFNNSLNEAVLHIDGSTAAEIQLSFQQIEFADEDNPMPASFSGSSFSDGVALSVDGTNWHRLVSLTGAASTNAYTTHTFNLTQFATSVGITLGPDVRIKFQQFDNSPIVSDGFAFDAISIVELPAAPEFDQASYAFSVAETASSGAAVGTVSATDANAGDLLTYSLSGTGASNFDINAGTGAITVSASAALNAVLTPTYNLTATVSDGSLSANVPVTITIQPVVEIAAAQVYYKGSAFANFGVNAALDPSKVVAQSGASPLTLSYANLSNTTFGITGLVIDVDRLAGPSLSASDFVFRMSPQGMFDELTNPPRDWDPAPSPTGIFVTPATATTPARVRLEWANNAIANRWLQVQVLNTVQTGLPVTQVLYFGHLQGELNGDTSIGDSFFVTNADLALVNPIGTLATVSNPRDIDKNRFVLNADGAAIRSSVNAGLSLTAITIPIAGTDGEGRVNGMPPGFPIPAIAGALANSEDDSELSGDDASLEQVSSVVGTEPSGPSRPHLDAPSRDNGGLVSQLLSRPTAPAVDAAFADLGQPLSKVSLKALLGRSTSSGPRRVVV